MEILKDHKWHDPDIEGVLFNEGNKLSTVEILIGGDRLYPPGSILLTVDEIIELALSLGIEIGHIGYGGDKK